MNWSIDITRLFAAGDNSPRYEQLAGVIEGAIVSGQLRAGERLPTVRQLSRDSEVSGTTIAAAYRLLSKRGKIRCEVGRGSFVLGPRSHLQSVKPAAFNLAAGSATMARDSRPVQKPGGGPWRRRALTTSAARLQELYPSAADCTGGMPDPSLLPWSLLQRAWKSAIDATHNNHLQYGGPEPIGALARALKVRIEADGVPCRESDLVIACSAQQLMVLAMDVAASLSGHKRAAVAVEEPGYPAIFDTYDRSQYELVGMQTDEFGAVPDSLEAALKEEISAVLFTPRAHNPTGASWSIDRMGALADVLAAHPRVLIMEDDHFADIASTRPGSLLSDPRIEDRVVCIRSFSKSLGPDLRIAAAVARPPLRSLLTEGKGFADGWTSRLTQLALANALVDPELDGALALARKTYTERRRQAEGALEVGLGPVGRVIAPAADGVNIWVHLPMEVDSAPVVERAAQLGVLVAPGEPFFIRPGRSDVVRLNACAVSAERAFEAGQALAMAALSAVGSTSAITV